MSGVKSAAGVHVNEQVVVPQLLTVAMEPCSMTLPPGPRRRMKFKTGPRPVPSYLTLYGTPMVG